MKICIITPNFPPMSWPCGAAHFVKSFAKNLNEAGKKVSVLTSNPDADTGIPGVHVEVIPGDWRLRHVTQLANWVKSQKFDVIDFQYEAAMYKFRPHCFSLPVQVGKSVKHKVLTLHSQDLPATVGGRGWRLAQFLPFDTVVFYSEPFLKRMEKWFALKKDRFFLQGFPTNIVRADGTDLDQMISKMKTDGIGDRPSMIYFGHINAGRGIEDILECCKKLKAENIDFQLTLMSQFNPEENDFHRELISWRKTHGLEKQISFTGRVEDKVVSMMMMSSDICLLPFPEGASFKNGSLAAAIDHGVPTITTKTDLTEKALLEGDVLQTYAPGDQEGLYRCMSSLLKSTDVRKELRTKTIAMRDIFSWKNYVEQRLEIYQLGRIDGDVGSDLGDSHA